MRQFCWAANVGWEYAYSDFSRVTPRMPLLRSVEQLLRQAARWPPLAYGYLVARGQAHAAGTNYMMCAKEDY